MSWAWVTVLPSSDSRNWIFVEDLDPFMHFIFSILQMLEFVDLLMICSFSMIVFYFL